MFFNKMIIQFIILTYISLEDHFKGEFNAYLYYIFLFITEPYLIYISIFFKDTPYIAMADIMILLALKFNIEQIIFLCIICIITNKYKKVYLLLPIHVVAFSPLYI